MSRFLNQKPIKQDVVEEAVILGNGPSLSRFLKENRSSLKNKSVFAVNYFARTKEYEEIKPEFYIICSPEYFLYEEKESFRKDREITFQHIASKTSWKMQLIVPLIARKKHQWKSEIIKNNNISIHYMNTTPIEGFTALRNILLKLNLGMPRPHNVLIPCIYLGINLNFKRIYLTGSDHSWLKEITVTENNDVLIGQKHFYDAQVQSQNIEKNKPEPQPMFKGTSLQKRRLHEVIEKFFVSFKSYWILKQYADYRDSSIINTTLDSYIDAFPKKKFE